LYVDVQLNNNICFLFCKKKTIAFKEMIGLSWKLLVTTYHRLCYKKNLLLRPIFNTTIMPYFLLG
jgi:hypothetical protein